MPCLHDEPAARLGLYDRMFTESRGLWFLTEPEADLARARHPGCAPSAVIGAGVDVPSGYHPERFRARFGIDGAFALVAGRRESGKGFDEMLDTFLAAVDGAGLDLLLALAGPAGVRLPERARGRVVDLGPLPRADLDDAMAAATAVLQPSPYESFSRTMMEAWLAGTPVVVNAASAVSVWHCARAGTGATYRDAPSLGAALAEAAEPEVRAAAAAGRDYVQREYTWPVVLDRVERVLDEWFGAAP